MPPRQCTDCHINNNYNLTSTACYSCHQKDYTATNNPAHAAAGFPTTCAVCHDTVAWTDSTFNHNNTPFPLTGSHSGATAKMRRLPRKQQLHDSADRLHRLSSDGLQHQHEPGPRRAAAVLPHYLPELPQHECLGECDVQSRRNTRHSQPVTATRITFALPATSTRITTPSSSAPVAMAATTRPISRTPASRVTSTTASIVTSVIKADRGAGRRGFKPDTAGNWASKRFGSGL